MSTVQPFISPDRYSGSSVKRCLICDGIIKNNEKTAELTVNNWSTFKNNAERWSRIAIPPNYYKHYTDVHSKIVLHDVPFSAVHGKCRIQFGTKMEW